MPKCCGIGMKKCCSMVSNEGDYCDSCKIKKLKEEIKTLKQENTSLRECVDSVLIRLSDYDGYKGHAKGLESLIDCAMKTLESNFPERVVNYKEEEVCPLCFYKWQDREE